MLVNIIRQYNVDRGVPAAQAYNITVYMMAGLLIVGFVCNACIRAVNERHYMEDEPAVRAAAAMAASN